MRISDWSSDVCSSDLDDALARIKKYTEAGEAKSVALLGNAADVLPELVRRGVRPDAVTDQTSAHDPVNGYLPQGWTVEQWFERRKADPVGTARPAHLHKKTHGEAMRAPHAQGEIGRARLYPPDTYAPRVSRLS